MFGLNKNLIRMDRFVGAGASGEVYEYGEDSKYVVKRIIANNVDEFISIIPEVVLGFSCNHPSFLKLKGFRIEREKKLFIIYIRFPKMKETLRKKLDEKKQIKEKYTLEEIIRNFHVLASVIEYLHHKSIYHRDIKPENILLDDNDNPVIADIGAGKFVPEEELDSKVSKMLGTVNYSAPEIIESNAELTNRDLQLADAWSLGMVMAEMCLIGHERDPSITKQGDKKEYYEDDFEEIEKRYGNILAMIIRGLLKYNLSERKTVHETRKQLESHFFNILVKMGLGEDYL